MNYELTRDAKKKEKLYKTLKILRQSSMNSLERLQDDILNDPSFIPWIAICKECNDKDLLQKL